MEKIPVGILGATGAVGQNYIRLLHNHPWFEVTYVAASPRSAGKKYGDAVAGKWFLEGDIPHEVRDLTIHDANDVLSAKGKCRFLFSALELAEKEAVARLETDYAQAGFPVVSNTSAHRGNERVPMLIPEINAHHLSIIDRSTPGFIVVKPNCSLQSYILPLFALMQAGFEIEKVFVTTLQAVSGAGYPGVPSLDMIDNVVPFIAGEEQKTEIEPLKILGSVEQNRIISAKKPIIAAHCTRVPVINGHTACVSVLFGAKKPSLAEITAIWQNFTALPQAHHLPSAPAQPIVVRDEANRPQPRKDRDVYGGMAISVGRLRECRLFDIRFVGLSHNTVRGAAGGGILNAEMLKDQGYLQ